MADWAGIFEKGIRMFTNYVIDQQDRVVDSLAKSSAEKFKIVYENRANKGESSKRLIEKAARKRNWKE